MAEITATMVKALRQETSGGMMECKKALQEADGDMSAAKDILRKKGLATAEKRASRATAQGLIVVKSDGKSAAMVEVVCETDFCARNQTFRDMVSHIVETAWNCDDGPVEPTDGVRDAVQQCLAKLKENMSFSRGVKISAEKVGTYVHHNGKVGVIVAVNQDLPDETLSGLCMHVAFANPMGITQQDIPPEVIEKETEIARAQVVESGKPAQVAEKIVAGKVKKFLADNVLLEQPFVRDEKKKVKDILGGATVTSFARFEVGN